MFRRRLPYSDMLSPGPTFYNNNSLCAHNLYTFFNCYQSSSNRKVYPSWFYRIPEKCKQVIRY